MGILFRNQASTNEKWFSLAWFVVIALSSYGLVQGFHPQPYIASASALLSTPFAILAWWPILKDTHPANKLNHKPFFVKVIVHTVLLAFAWVFIFFALSKGLPGLGTKHFGESRSRQALVTYKSSGMGARFECAHYLIAEARSPATDNSRLCVSKEFWQKIAVGNIVQIDDRTSPLGSFSTVHE